MAARILMVSPVRNEARHIERVVRAVAAQTVPPADWIVVDDGSTDGTLEQLRALEPEVPFMRVLSRAHDDLGGARDRLAQAVEVRNFHLGLAAVDVASYTHVMKLDGDVELPSGYLSGLLERFAADPRLGLAGGALVEPGPGGEMRPIKIPPHHVHGAVKCFTRECYEAIGGIQERLAWDTIDETYARMRGYRTRTFAELAAVHHRPFASADGILRGRARHGECAYIAQFPPLWVSLRALKVARSTPVGLSGVAFLYGYVRAAARRTERVDDPSFRRFVRGELRDRMMRPWAQAPVPGPERLEPTR